MSAIRMVDSLAKTLGHDVIGEEGEAMYYKCSFIFSFFKAALEQGACHVVYLVVCHRRNQPCSGRADRGHRRADDADEQEKRCQQYSSSR